MSDQDSVASARLFSERLEQARHGSDEALGQLVQSCRDYLLLVANQELADGLQGKLGASDAVQETLAVAHQRFGQFRGTTREELIGWLRTILKNHLMMTNRRYTAAKRDVGREQAVTESAGPLADRHPTPRTTAIEAENGQRLRAALSALSEDHRRVILLRNWEQLPFSTVAEKMGRSEEAAKKLWSRAMHNLKQHLTDEAPKESS